MLLLLTSLLVATAPGDSLSPRPITQWIHTRWTTTEGAPREILHLAQSPDGYLWLTAWGKGLFRFDGVRFVSIPLKIGDTLPMRGVERIVPARDTSLWLVLAEGKVGHFRNGYLTAWGEPEEVPRTFDLAMSSSGSVVIGTAHGIRRFTDGRWEDVTRKWDFPGTRCRTIWFDSHDGLWAGTEDRVVYLAPGATAFREVGFRYKNPNAPPPRFAEGHDGTIWVGEQGRSVHTIPMLDGSRAMTEVLVGSKNVVVDRKGTLWIGTAGEGLRRLLDPPRLLGRQLTSSDPDAEPFTEKEGLLSNAINVMLADREGNVWVGGSRGLERFREPPFVQTPSQASRRASILFTTRDTSLWIAPFASDLQRLRAGEHQPGVKANFHPTLLTQTRDGRLWTTDTHFLYRLQGEPPYVPVRIRGREMHVVDMTGDRDGNLWVFDQTTGLLRLTGDSLALEVAITDSTYPHASLFTDSSGAIWISFFRRLVRYHDGHLTTFPLAGSGTFGSEAWSLVQDGTGAVWVGGQFGLGRLEGDRFRSLTRMPGGIVMGGLTIDGDGAWWYATTEGLVRLPQGEVDRAMADTGYRIQYRLFTQADGLLGEINGSLYGPIVTRTADGMLWVVTDSGVSSIHPHRLPAPVVAPARIETIRVDDRELAPNPSLTLPPLPGNVEIDYTAMTLTVSERMQFRYQLVGEDGTWREVGTRRRAYYTGLGPGRYTFRVMTGTPDGAWSETAATMNFRILPAWYQTLWSKALLVLVLVAVTSAVAASVQRRRHRRSQEALTAQFKATLAERTRIAQDLHDSLLQGFAGVTLQLKAVEREIPANPDSALATVLQVQRLAFESMREARARVWDMHTTTLADQDLPAALEVMARERTAGSGIEVSVTTTGHCPRLAAPIEDSAFRIGREAVSNAVLHAAPRRIDIMVTCTESILTVEVRDDGCGFTAEQGEEAHRRGHFGLSGMRDRAAQIGGTCTIAARAGGGTVIRLELPKPEGAAG